MGKPRKKPDGDLETVDAALADIRNKLDGWIKLVKVDQPDKMSIGGANICLEIRMLKEGMVLLAETVKALTIHPKLNPKRHL